MQLPLPLHGGAPVSPTLFIVAGRAIPVDFVRHERARHYILRVDDDGGLRVTIPRGGSRREAERFLRERRAWIERERYRQILEASRRGPWRTGTRILMRGEEATLDVAPAGGQLRVRFADQVFMVSAAATADLRPHVEGHLQRVAGRELTARLAELASTHDFHPARVTVRNQRSRWGACSLSGRISLNWRLIQAPPSVRDYVLLHELVHLRHLNHSARFWRELERLCPWYQEARAWLRRNHQLRPGRQPDSAA
jgi:predicted metal-dependent hydrolase